VFSATVTDNQDVLEVVLYYRVADSGDYLYAPMQAIPGTSIYTVTVDIDTTESVVLEYYVNASDVSNNRVVKGFSFDPLLRTLEAPEQIATAPEPVPAAETAATTPAPAAPSMTTGRKILYGALGILAVGALAAAANSGGGGGASSTPSTPGGPSIPLIITVDTVGSEFD